jgi:NAD(P)H-dependent FMN reductase
MEEILKERGHTVYFIDPLELNLPLLDKMYKEIIDPPENLKLLRNQIVEADGYMPITPEYNHSTSAA